MRISNTYLGSFTIIVLFLIVSRCSSKGKRDVNDLTKSSVEITPDTVMSDTIKQLQISLLEGVWWLSPDDIHALFYVIGDSLYYTEEQQSPYFIELKEKTLIMSQDSATFKFEIRKITADSLILYDQNMNEITRLYKASPDN